MKLYGCDVPAAEAGVVGLAAAMACLVDAQPLLLSVWGPWDFSWPAFIAAGFSLLWFLRGLRRSRADTRITGARIACFLIGVVSIYVVLLTRFEYAAQHMFALNRVQHAVLHHFGPFLIALSWPGETLSRGMPTSLRRFFRSPALARAMRVVQRPVVATLLFEGLLIFWLLPPVVFAAMFNWTLYGIMNDSMLIDGLLFWFIVLDPRPAPEAAIGFFPRLAMAFLIIFPQIAVGTLLGLMRSDLYPFFSLCGRVYPTIGPLLDQQIGGLVLWVPAGMMSAFASVLIMWRMFTHEDTLAQVVA